MEYFQEIRRYIELDLLSEAFNCLKDWTDSLMIEEYRNQYSSLISRFNALTTAIRKGTVNHDESTIDRNKIIIDILEFCLTIEKMGPSSSTRKGEKGVLAHNIPGAMKKGLQYECKVRIAKEELTVLEKFDPAAPVEALSISDEMEVELIDVQGNAFEIKTHNRKIQTILDNEATEWIFYVNPLQIGKHILILKAAVFIVASDNQKRAKEYTYTKEITIETATKISVKPLTNNNWQVVFSALSIIKNSKQQHTITTNTQDTKDLHNPNISPRTTRQHPKKTNTQKTRDSSNTSMVDNVRKNTLQDPHGPNIQLVLEEFGKELLYKIDLDPQYLVKLDIFLRDLHRKIHTAKKEIYTTEMQEQLISICAKASYIAENANDKKKGEKFYKEVQILGRQILEIAAILK